MRLVSRKILVTGGAGFIGCHLAECLAADGTDEVVLVDNLARGRRDAELQALAARPNVRLLNCDLTSADAYRELGVGYDEVYHLAAIVGVRPVVERPHEVLRVNLSSTLLLCDWLARGGGTKILFSSTSEAYAWTQLFHPLPIPTPEDVPLALVDLTDPRSSYAGSKVCGELIVTQFCHAFAKAFTIVRYHNVYGPRMGYDHVIPELFVRASAGENPLAVYSTEHSRAFCYISDAVDATVAAMRQETANGKTINVGNDREEVTIGAMAAELLKVAGIRATIEPRAAANDPVRRRCPDISRARALLGYEPQVTLRQGLERTLAWYADRQRRQREPRCQEVGQ